MDLLRLQHYPYKRIQKFTIGSSRIYCLSNPYSFTKIYLREIGVRIDQIRKRIADDFLKVMKGQ